MVLNSGVEIKQNCPLASYTSWQVGGVAEYFCTPIHLAQVQEALEYAREHQLPLTLLGSGTNTLISDQGIQGLTLCTKKLKSLEVDKTGDRLKIIAESGVLKTELLKVFLREKLVPAEFLAGVPGDVGGGIVMNAGVGESIRPREFVEITDWVEVIDLSPGNEGVLKKYENHQLQWSYRHCHGWEPGVIYRVQLSWPLEPDPEVIQRVRAANQIRLKKQPLDQPSCGSVFINPEGFKAGKLIDECGLRGFRIGGAQVSEKHANFILNTGKARASDIDQVIRHVQKMVKEKKGIQLKTEVVYLGSWSTPKD